jgi:serine phosphatase RsbU (regulator of sigma subunit)
VEALGFRLVIDTRLQSRERWVAVSPADGSTILQLVVPKPKSAESKLIGRAPQVVFVTSDITAKFQEWSRRGVRFLTSPRLRHIKDKAPPAGDGSSPSAAMVGLKTPVGGSASVRFRDIDGNVFSLVSFDGVTHTIEAERRAAAVKLEAERRAARELEIAKEVQARMFPQFLPALSTLEYAGTCIQARQVGGDYYDFLQLGPDRLGMVIADVAGKGIAAALLMANLQASFRSQFALALEQPQRLLQKVNRLFCDNTPDGTFATLFFADYDDSSGYLRYANCGHLCGLLIRRDGSVERLTSTSTVLGIFRTWDCTVGESLLRPGDLLTLYTDGVTESMDHASEEYGETRLIGSLRRYRHLAPDSLITSVVADIRAFNSDEQHDDITLIVARRRLVGKL